LLASLNANAQFLRSHYRPLAFGLIHAFCSAPGQTFCIGLFGTAFAAEFGLDPTALGTLYLVATLAAAVGLTQIGHLIDRSRLRLYSLGASSLLLIACLVTAAAPGVWVFGLGLFLLRLSGQGLMVHIEGTATARAFDANRGKALGITALGIPLSQAAFPPVAAVLLALLDWRLAYAALGLGAFVLLLIAAFALPAHLAGRQVAFDRAEQLDEPAPSRRAALKLLAESAYFRAALPMLFVVPFMFTGLLFHIKIIAEAGGWSEAAVAFAYTPMALGFAVAMVVSGNLIDRIGARRLALVHALPQVAALALLAFLPGDWGLVAALTLTGIAAGAGKTTFTALWAEIYGTRQLGTIKSFITPLMVVSTAAAPPVFGFLIDSGIGAGPAMAALAAFGFVLHWPLWVLELRRRLSPST
jgi:MFS family permease